MLPATHPLARARACESYKQVHEALSAALMLAGVDCRLQPADCKPAAAPMTAACFAKAETFDVVRSDNGRKIAGAAQKRTQQGLLFQGTAARRETKEVQDWTQLENNFARLLADLLKLQLGVAPQRPGSEKALAEVAAQFAATEWNQKR